MMIITNEFPYTIFSSGLEQCVFAVSRLSRQLDMLSDKFSKFTNGINAIPALGVTPQISNPQALKAKEETTAVAGESQLQGTAENVTTGVGQVAESVNKFNDVLKSVTGVAEAWGLGSKVEKLKDISGGLDSYNDMVTSASNLSATTGVATALELGNVAKSAGGMFNGLLSSSAGRLGLVGLAFERTWAYNKYRETKNEPIEDKTTFLTGGRYPEQSHLLDIKAGKNSAEEISRIARIKPEGQLRVDRQEYMDKWSASKGQIHFDEWKAVHDPSYLKALGQFMMNDANKFGKQGRQLIFDTPEQKQDFGEYLDPLNQFNLSVADPRRVHWKAIGPRINKDDRSKIMYEKQYDFDKSEMMNFMLNIDANHNLEIAKAVQGYNLYGPEYVKGFEQKLYNMFGMNEFGKKASADAVLQYRRAVSLVDGGRERNEASTPQSSNRPSITFNRGLIEHFTINVKDAKEGMRDFKRKVEEALLEILKTVTYN